MNDPILEAFLRRQLSQGLELAGQSDLLDLMPVSSDGRVPDHYFARFHCKGLVRLDTGEVAEASEFHVGIWFPSDYLRHVEPAQVLTWLDPPQIFHPNIRAPAICAGRIVPGTELVDLLYQVFEMITYQNWAPHDPLNPAAAQWARNHQDLFPVDRRPLRRRKIAIAIQTVREGS